MSVRGYFVTRPIKELSFNTGPLAGQYFPVPQNFVLSAEEVESWPQRAYQVAVGPDGYLAPTDAEPSDVRELVLAAGSSTGVQGDGGTGVAVPAATDEGPAEDAAAEETVTDTAGGESFPVHLGHGVYRLSDGTDVKGRQKAISAEAALGS